MSSVARRPYLSIVFMALGCWALVIGVAGAGWLAVSASGYRTAVAGEPEPPVAATCPGDARRVEVRVAALGA